MAIKNLPIGNGGKLVFNVDTILDPGTAGSISPSSTLVYAMDIIVWTGSNLSKIREIDLYANRYLDFNLITPMLVSTVQGMFVEASSKYPNAPAGAKLLTTRFPIKLPSNILTANPEGTICLRIRTIVLDPNEPTSPAIPTSIDEFDAMVVNLGNELSVANFHNKYYSCTTIPLQLDSGAKDFTIDSFTYYDIGLNTDNNLFVSGTSTFPVDGDTLQLKWTDPSISEETPWEYIPNMNVSYDGTEYWEAYVTGSTHSELLVGKDNDTFGTLNDILSYQCLLTGVATKPDGSTVTASVLSLTKRPIPVRIIKDISNGTEAVYNKDPVSFSSLEVADLDTTTGQLKMQAVVKVYDQSDIDIDCGPYTMFVRTFLAPQSNLSTTYTNDIPSVQELHVIDKVNIVPLGALWTDPSVSWKYADAIPDGNGPLWQVLQLDLPVSNNLMDTINAYRADSGDTCTTYVIGVETIVVRNGEAQRPGFGSDPVGFNNFFSKIVQYDYRNITYFSTTIDLPSTP